MYEFDWTFCEALGRGKRRRTLSVILAGASGEWVAVDHTEVQKQKFGQQKTRLAEAITGHSGDDRSNCVKMIDEDSVHSPNGRGKRPLLADSIRVLHLRDDKFQLLQKYLKFLWVDCISDEMLLIDLKVCIGYHIIRRTFSRSVSGRPSGAGRTTQLGFLLYGCSMAVVSYMH